MDPLSFTASLLTILGTIGVIGTGLQKLVALKHAPAILHALNDEVASLYCVVQAVDFLTRQHAEIIHTAPIENLRRALKNSRSTLLELEDLIRDKLTVELKDGERRLDRSVWLFAATKVQKLRDQIRADRIDLSSALSLLASSASLGVELQLQQLCFTIQTLGDRVLLMGAVLSNQVQSPVRHRIRAQEFRDGQFLQSEQLEAEQTNGNPSETYSEMTTAQIERPPATAHPDMVPTAHPYRPSSDSMGELSRRSTLVENDVEPPQVHRKVRHQSLPLSLPSSTCSLNCTCTCHRRNRLKSPDVLNTVLGSLMVGYKASPWSSQTCDKKSCRSRATKITYAFPQWLLRRAISLSMAYSHPQGPDFCLRVVRVRPGDADIFTAVFRGTRNHVQRLLDDGDASVLDVDPAHNTALHWAIRRMDLPTIEMLINAGSDLFYENSSGSFPYSVAWERILGEPNKYHQDDLDILEMLFSDRSELAFFHFSALHRGCLGLSGTAFADVLASTTRSALDVVDNTGRTTLSWAAQRGDVVAVEGLLERGANPNRADLAHKTPLHWSVNAESNECMVLLLRNDASIDAKDDYGRTTLSNVSSKKEDPGFLEALLRFNADIETEDDEGWRALHWAAHKDQPTNITLLLNNGADSSATDKLGRNPLHAAMLRNCHRAIEVLINKGACGAPGKTALGSTTLHIAADYGDIKTLQLLQLANLGNINITEENCAGQTAQNIAEGRRDDNEDWSDSTCQDCDLDPAKWYQAWETFEKHIIAGPEEEGSRAENGEWDSIRSAQLSGSQSSDWETIDREDGNEVWEEALETSNGSPCLSSVLDNYMKQQ